MHDIIIKNGIVFDGSGETAGVRTDIAIENDRVVDIDNLRSEPAHHVIDAKGMYVAPGFIDIQNHSDSHGQILLKPALESMVAQGVTTVVIGQCGASLAPLPKPESIKSLQKWGLIEGLNADWQTFADFKNRLKQSVFGTNVATFVGHATMRRIFTGDVSRSLKEDEIDQLALLLKRSLDEGAFGMSFGFQYAHEIKTTSGEIAALISVIKKKNKIFSLHLRSQENGFLNALHEAVELAKAQNVKTKISHLKVEGKKNFGQLNPAIDILEQAYQSGTEVRFDVYPYTTTWKALYTYVPNWAYEGGFKPLLARMKDKKLRQRMLNELSEQRRRIGGLLVTNSPKVSGFIGQTISQIAKRQKQTPEETLLRILSSNHGQTIVFDHDVDGSQVTQLIKHPLSFVASDGTGYPIDNADISDLPHPRCFGSFPRFLRLLRDDKEENNDIPLMTWQEGIAKITGQPAQYLGLENRGLIKKKFAADLVVFDPNVISDTATYQNPFKAPKGIQYVVTNGKISVFEGQLTDVYGGKLLTAK